MTGNSQSRSKGKAREGKHEDLAFIPGYMDDPEAYRQRSREDRHGPGMKDTAEAQGRMWEALEEDNPDAFEDLRRPQRDIKPGPQTATRDFAHNTSSDESHQ